MLGIHQYLWRLVPANPILLRVVETGGKRRRDLFIRCGYLGLLVAFVVFSLMAGSGDGGGGNLASLAKRSAALFEKMSYLQLGLVALLAPVFTAGAITQEKDSQTYDILLATPLTNGQIVLGSLLSRLFFVVALLVSGIPVFSITQIFGGVAIKSIVLSFLIAAATAFATGALAMAIATFKVGTRRTIFSFYLFIVVYMAGGIVLDQFPRFQVDGPVNVTKVAEAKQAAADEGTDGTPEGAPPGSVSPASIPPASATPAPAGDGSGFTKSGSGSLVLPSSSAGRAHISWFTGLNPFLALRVLFRSPDYAPPAFEDLPAHLKGWPTGWYLSDPAGFYITAMFAFSLVLVMPSIVLLRRMAQSTTSLKTLILQKLKLSTGDRTRKPRVVWSNPIAWREAKTKASAARATVLRYGFIAAGLLVAGYLVVQYATTGALRRPVAGGSYDAKTQMLSLPPARPGAWPERLYVPTNPSPPLDPRAEVTVDAQAGDGGKRPFDLRDLQSPLEVAGYETYVKTDPKLNTDMALYRVVEKLGDGKVIKSLDLRPPSRGIDLGVLRKYMLGACAVEFAVILLIVTNAAASTVTREKEDGTLDLLLSSPITSRYYIWGKLRGLVSFVLPLVAVPTASVAAFLVYDAARAALHGPDALAQWTVFPEAVLLLPAMLVIVCAFAAILGMQMSLRCRTTVTAVMASVGIVVGVCAGMGWCGYSVLKGSSDVALAVGSFSPFTLMQMLIDPYGSGDHFGRPGGGSGGIDDNALFQGRMLVFVFTAIAVAAYVGIVWNMYTGMVKNFDMTIRKQAR
jgi:ABC-type transport system involved in multi-copper enzyme maturation permease subunit